MSKHRAAFLNLSAITTHPQPIDIQQCFMAIFILAPLPVHGRSPWFLYVPPISTYNLSLCGVVGMFHEKCLINCFAVREDFVLGSQDLIPHEAKLVPIGKLPVTPRFIGVSQSLVRTKTQTDALLRTAVYG